MSERKRATIVHPETFGIRLEASNISPERIGFAMFTAASWTYPNTEVGQGTQIATYCRGTSFNPLELGQAVMRSRQLVWDTQELAIKAHRESGTGPLDLKATKTADVMGRVFRLSHQMLALEPSAIDYITRVLLPKYKKPDEHYALFDEQLLRKEVDAMIRAKGIVPFI